MCRGITGRLSAVLSYLAGPVCHPMIPRGFDTYVQVLAGAARVNGPVPLGGSSYLSGGGCPAWPGQLARESNIG
jgi:hypothetical protein